MAESQTDARLEIAYADHRDNRMIIIGGAAWPTLAEQERHFEALPAVENSDFVIDFYGDDGVIEKDKCVTQETVEAVMLRPIDELIEEGRRREDELTKRLRAQSKAPSDD